MDADENADWRQHLGEERQSGLRPFRPSLSRRAAPVPVGGERPYADHAQNQHHLFEHGVERAEGDQDGGDRIAKTGLRQALHRLRGQRRTLVGQQQHDGRQRRGDKQAKTGREQSRQSGQGFLGGGCLGAPQARGGADEQDARDAAADRRFRQRHIDREQANPDKRKQEPIDDVADRGRERPRREYGPGGDRKHQEGEADVERLQNAHIAGPLRRTARPMSWAAVAPAN